MENILYELLEPDKSYTKPGFHFLSYKEQVDDVISHYIHVQIVYEHLNQVKYTTVELDITDQSCSRIQFHAGYHIGGTTKPKKNPRDKHSICALKSGVNNGGKFGIY